MVYLCRIFLKDKIKCDRWSIQLSTLEFEARMSLTLGSELKPLRCLSIGRLPFPDLEPELLLKDASGDYYCSKG
jgi:hypothetical protein